MLFRNGKLDQCLKRLESVNKNATKALSLLDSPGNESRRLDDIVLAKKVVLLVLIDHSNVFHRSF